MSLTIDFTTIMTTTVVVELLFLSVFRLVPSGGGSKWMSINQWYTGLRWSAVLLDILSIMVGFYIALAIYNYLLKENMIRKDNQLITLLAIVLCVQILHDILFYTLVIKNTPMGINQVMDEFIDYAEKVGINAIIGDSLMYIIGTPLLLYMNTQSHKTKEFVSIISLYITGYLIYHKPS